MKLKFRQQVLIIEPNKPERHEWEYLVFHITQGLDLILREPDSDPHYIDDYFDRDRAKPRLQQWTGNYDD